MGGGVSAPVTPRALPDDNYCIYDDKEKQFIYDIHHVRPIKFAKTGQASEEVTPAITIIDLFKTLVKNKPDLSALRVERPCPPLVDGKAPPAMSNEEMTHWTYNEYYNEARTIAAGLITLDFKRRDSVCIFGFNSPEWNMAAIAGVFAGGCFTGIYPTDSQHQILWKIQLSNCSVMFVESEAACNKVLAVADDAPYLKAIVCWGDALGCSSHARSDGSTIKLLSWADAKQLAPPDDTNERMDEVAPDQCCALVFTSGTTGNPKAVMVSHDNVLYLTRSVKSVVDKYIDYNQLHRSLSYLPLSHIAGIMTDILIPLTVSALCTTWSGVEVTFARPYDLKAGSLGDRLRMTRPTMFLGVPRVWEKVQEKLVAIGSKTKGVKKKVVRWAKNKGLAYAENQQIGKDGRVPFLYGKAKKKVLNAIAEKLGLDKCVFGCSGAAPMKRETIKFFGALGIQINDLYGESECAGVCTMTEPQSHLWGCNGFPIPGIEVKIFHENNGTECPLAKDIFDPKPEEEGEICIRGRNVMLGYMSNPSLGQEHVNDIIKKNEATIDKQGWLHSGDKGCKGENQLIRITGRFKELIVTAGGENIPPVPIEEHLMSICPVLSNVVMIGDQRKYNTALVTLAAEGATGESPGTDQLLETHVRPGVTTISQAMKDPDFIQELTDAIKATNANGKICPSNAAKIQKFSILPTNFSIEQGLLTPTLKLRRSEITREFANTIEKMYHPDSKDPYVRFEP
mmetsp:Transcript_10573/g.17252  ORF Transcript_10573/g.17252 Transcript_10573/m.17252 type:complete len:737 (+) Transcript_10573:1790-4000(+)